MGVGGVMLIQGRCWIQMGMFEKEKGNTRCDQLRASARARGRWYLHEGLCCCQLQAFRKSASTPKKKSRASFFEKGLF